VAMSIDPQLTNAPGSNAVALGAAVIEQLVSLGSATLYEAAGRIGALPCRVASTSPRLPVCGRAFPVETDGGDNLAIHHAIYAAQPGDVLVVNVSGAREYGYFGEVMARAAMAVGVAGLVIDGGVRDADRMADLGFPVFAANRCINGTTKRPDAVLAVGSSTKIGEITIFRGDVVVGDGDGVVVIQASDLDAVVTSSERREVEEGTIFERLQAGESTIDIYRLAQYGEGQ